MQHLSDRTIDWLWLTLAILLAAAGAWQASVPPKPLPAAAPADTFSAGRAIADVQAVGRAPHPAGSAEHGRVLRLLFQRMAALGVDPRIVPDRAVKVTQGHDGTAIDGADVRNLIGTLPGRDRAAPAVLLMAHYDSVPSSPGAADDGAGIAAALEIVRALRAGGPLHRDVILLFSDAEEDGLLGARAFFASAVARRIGFVINMDVRGGAGRAIMHETGSRSGGAIAVYRRTAIHPTTDSIAAYVERLIRNSSDFRIAVDRGLPGLNYAFLDKQFDYHAASSTVAALDRRSLQHLGEQVLAVTRAVAADPQLPQASADPAYASVLGWFVLAYPPWIGWLIAAAGMGLAIVAWRGSDVSFADMMRATGAALYLLLTLILLLTLARLATGVPFGFTAGRPLLARWEVYEAALALLCVAGPLGWWAIARNGSWRIAIVTPLLIGGLILLAGGSGWIMPAMAAVAALLAIPAFRGSMGGKTIMFGLFGAVTIITGAILVMAPVAAVVASWSLLGGGVLALASGGPRFRALAVAACVAGALVAQQLATAHLLMLAVGETLASVAAPFAVFAALVLAPLLARVGTARGAGVAALAIGGAGAVLVLAIRLGDPASAARPGISQIVHVSDMASGRFYRVTSLAFPDAWTKRALGPDPASVRLLPVYETALIARGEPVVVAPISVRSRRLAGGDVLVRFAGAPGTREIRIAITASVAMRAAQVNGIAVPLLAAPGRIDRLGWVGRDPVVTLRLAPRRPGRLVARVSALRDGWPTDARPLILRPATTMPWYDSDTALTLSTASISW